MSEKRGSIDKTEKKKGEKKLAGAVDKVVADDRQRKVGKAMTVDELENLILKGKSKKSVAKNPKQSSFEQSVSQESTPRSVRRGDTDRRGSEKNADRRGSEKNADRRGSEKNADRRGSEKNADRRGSEKNADRRGSEKITDRRGSEKNTERPAERNRKDDRVIEDDEASASPPTPRMRKLTVATRGMQQASGQFEKQRDRKKSTVNRRGSFLSVPQEGERGEQSEDPPSDVQIEVPPQLQPQPSQSRMARRMSMATAVMAKMADDKASKPDLVQRLNDKFRLIKDPAQFQILERKVEVLAAEKEMLTDYNVALDEENNSLKTMMVELTKSRCRKDLEQLRKRQIDIEKESLTTFPSNISMMPSPTRERNHPISEQENQSRNFVNLQKSESCQQQREQENKSPQMQTPKFNPFQMRQQGNENQRIQSSPMHTFNQLSPMHTANKMSAMHTANQMSPIHTVNQMSSIHRNNQASPPHITNNQNPMYTTNQLGPMHTMNQLSPARTLNPQQSPSRMMNTFVSKAKSLHQQNQNEMRPSYQSDSRGANTNQSELRSMNQTAVVNGISQSTMNSMKQLAMNRFQIPVVGNNIVQTQEQVYHQPANGVGVKATPPPPGDMEPRLLSIPLEEWDKLKYQADLVLEENQVLVDQKKLYKKTIDDLTYEFQTKMKTHSEEILLLMQDKNTLEEELLMTNQDRENAKEELSEIRKNYRTLEEKYGECVSELDKKIDMRIHKEQLDKLNRLKTNEINMSANENNNLKSRLGALGIEKDRLAIKVTDLTAENSELNMRIKITDSELKKTKQKLNQSVIKAEAASCQELIIRKTLSQVIKVAEKTVIDRNLLADIVRQEKLKDNKLKDAINYVYRTTTIDPDTYLHNPEPLSYGDKAQSSNSNNYNGKSYGDKVCGDKGFEYEDNFSDKLSSPLSERDKRLIDFNLGDKTNDLFPTRDNNNNNNNSINNNNYNSDKNKVNDGDKIGEIRGRLNYPVTDLQKFREKHEMELNDLKDMVRMKQSYIDQIQKNLPS